MANIDQTKTKLIPASRLYFIRKHRHRVMYKLLWIIGDMRGNDNEHTD